MNVRAVSSEATTSTRALASRRPLETARVTRNKSPSLGPSGRALEDWPTTSNSVSLVHATGATSWAGKAEIEPSNAPVPTDRQATSRSRVVEYATSVPSGEITGYAKASSEDRASSRTRPVTVSTATRRWIPHRLEHAV